MTDAHLSRKKATWRSPERRRPLRPSAPSMQTLLLRWIDFWLHYVRVSALSARRVCLVTGKSRLARLALFFLLSASSFFFLSLSLSLFHSLSLSLSSTDLRRPAASKSLFMRAIMRSKALHSVAVPRGPVAFLSIVSCPIPFTGVDERTWCTNNEKKKKKKKAKASSRLFLGGGQGTGWGHRDPDSAVHQH